MTEHGSESRGIVGIFAERVVVGYRFRLGIDHKFIGIAPASLAIQGCAPWPKNLLEFFLWNFREAADRLPPERTKRSLRDLADAGNLSNLKRRQETRFAAGRNPN